MARQSFWSNEALHILMSAGRQDLIDRGDAFAERVAALLLSATERLKQYAEDGDLYNGRGGISCSSDPDAIAHLEEFVNIRLRNEIQALENLLSTFDDIKVHETKF